MAKTGKPFVVPPDIEIKILTIKDLGFGLTVNQVRRVAFKVVEAAGINHPFNREIQMACWYWRDKLRERYNLSLRTPQNLSICRASIANKTLHNDLDKVKNLLTKVDLKDKPAQIWNCDETGLTFVIKNSKTACQVGRKYVYKQSFGDRGATTTLLCCVCASGMSIPPMVILKGVRMKGIG